MIGPETSHLKAQFRTIIAIAAFGLALLGCAPTVNVRTDTAPGVNMAQFQTYNFFSQLGVEQDGYSNLLGQHFRSAISQQMNSRGYSESDAPQLQINVTAATDDKVRVNTYSDPYLYGGYYGGYRGGYWGAPMYAGNMGTRTTVTQYTQANLYIDIVDANQHKMIWQGVATFTLTDKMKGQVSEAVNKTVAEIFAKYPVPAK